MAKIMYLCGVSHFFQDGGQTKIIPKFIPRKIFTVMRCSTNFKNQCVNTHKFALDVTAYKTQ